MFGGLKALLFNVEKVELNFHMHFHFDGDLQKLPEPKREVLDRFQTIINDHCVTAAQLVRLVPPDWNWSILNVTDPDQFLASLRPKQFEWFSETFRVERRWLEGAESCPAHWLDGDRDPARLLKSLDTLGWLDQDLRMTVCVAERDYSRGDLPRMLVTIFSHPIAAWDNGGTTIFRHAQFGGLWDLCHPPCYMNFMAVARWYVRVLNSFGRIPIVPISPDDFADLYNMRVHPAKFFTTQYGGYGCLSDHVLHPLDGPNGESACSRRNTHLPAIIEYMDRCGMARQSVGSIDAKTQT